MQKSYLIKLKKANEQKIAAEKLAEAQEFAKVQRRNETFWALFFPVLTFLLGMGTYIAIYFGGIHILEGEMTVGELVQFVTYSGYLFGPLSWMTHLPRAIMEMVTSLNRIYDVLAELNRYPDSKQDNTQVLFAPMGDEELRYALRWAGVLRAEGINTEVYPEPAKMKKQMGYADQKQIPWVGIIGGDEMAAGTVMLKNMLTGEQKQINREELASLILRP